MSDYIWPWPKGTTASQEFGTNPGGVNPVGGHTGLDAPLPAGTPLRAPCDGVIVFEGWANLNNNPFLLTDGGGICLAIDAGNGKPAFIMGHLSATFVNNGQRVTKGQIIAESGNTGRWTTGPHVHLESLPPVYDLRSNTYGRVNPRNYCKAYWEDVTAPAKDAPLLPYQRETKTKVNQRVAPDHNAPVVKLWDEGLAFDFGGFGIGSDPYGDGNRVWFKGRYSDTWFHSSAFTDMGTHDLPDLTPPGTVPADPPKPAPVDPPKPTPGLGDHLNGIDISMHQDSALLQNIPADFYLIKASEGGGDWTDPALARNVAEARQTGKPLGFYHFARPLHSSGNTAAEEARSFLAVIKPHLQLGDVLVLDWEAENQDRTDWALEWLRLVKTATGATPFVYLNPGAINGADWSQVEKEFPLWLASYGANEPGGYKPGRPSFPTEWERGFLMWQYTSRGKLPGYEGDLDLNVFYGTTDQFRALGATRTLQQPAPIPVPDPGPVPDPVLDAQKIIDDYNAWLRDRFLGDGTK